jgi:hypothetical protein
MLCRRDNNLKEWQELSKNVSELISIPAAFQTFEVSSYNVLLCNYKYAAIKPSSRSTVAERIILRKIFVLLFGDYIFVPSEPSIKNSMELRSLYPPTGNRTGSVKFYSLANDSVISRTQWTKAPIYPMAHLSKYKDSVMETGTTRCEG